jgi:hypothetical protein
MNYPVPEKYLSHQAPNYISVPEYRHEIVRPINIIEASKEKVLMDLISAFSGVFDNNPSLTPMRITSRMRTSEEQQALRERAVNEETEADLNTMNAYLGTPLYQPQRAAFRAPSIWDNQKYIRMHMPLDHLTEIKIPTLPKTELTFTFFPSKTHQKPSFALFRPLFARIKRLFQNLI